MSSPAVTHLLRSSILSISTFLFVVCACQGLW